MLTVTKSGRNEYTVTNEFGITHKVLAQRHPVLHRRVLSCTIPHHNVTNCDMIKAVSEFLKAERKVKPVKPTVTLDMETISTVPLPSTIAPDSVKPTVRQAIENVVTFLNRGGKDAELFWNILTALRGPDSDYESLKENTTCNIRGAIGLKQNFGAIVKYDTPAFLDMVNDSIYGFQMNSKMKEIYPFDAVQHHFVNHYKLALQALIETGYLKP